MHNYFIHCYQEIEFYIVVQSDLVVTDGERGSCLPYQRQPKESTHQVNSGRGRERFVIILIKAHQYHSNQEQSPGGFGN